MCVKLAEWAVSHNVTHSALGSLLGILKQHHVNLPADPRTLLKTPQAYNIKQIVGVQGQVGQYCHFGIASGINNLLSLNTVGLDAFSNNKLELQFNFDGLPLFKSSCLEFWPILCLIRQFKSNPFVVGIYCGSKKPPSVPDYVQDFVEKLSVLLANGITCNAIHFSVVIDCFVCDAPARSFIKNVKSHNGYHGCEKCTQEGVYLNNRMTYPDCKATLRTDADFEKMTDEDHHHGPTPLSVLPIGLVTGFVLDYMHLVCLGVVRKLLKFWLCGSIHASVAVASRLPAFKQKYLWLLYKG